MPMTVSGFPRGLLALSDGQLEIVMLHAHPLQPDARSQFLEAVSAKLAGVEPGDGVVSRACRELQRQFFEPPDSIATGRWERKTRLKGADAQARFAAALPKDG